MFADINSIKLWYEDEGKGKPIVFIHGLGEQAVSWHYQVEAFREAYRTINLDLRGHGRSTFNSEEPITIDLFARDILALLDQLEIDKAVFVGHSMGGLICQELALLAGQRMTAMVLSDSAAFYPQPLPTVGLQERLKYLETATMEDMAELVADKCCNPFASAALRQEVKALFMDNTLEPYRQSTIATFQSDYRGRHEVMTMPTLLLVGEYDQTTPLSYAEFLRSALTASRLAIISQAAHMSKVENPQEYNSCLQQFFTDIGY